MLPISTKCMTAKQRLIYRIGYKNNSTTNFHYYKEVVKRLFSIYRGKLNYLDFLSISERVDKIVGGCRISDYACRVRDSMVDNGLISLEYHEDLMPYLTKPMEQDFNPSRRWPRKSNVIYAWLSSCGHFKVGISGEHCYTDRIKKVARKAGLDVVDAIAVTVSDPRGIEALLLNARIGESPIEKTDGYTEFFNGDNNDYEIIKKSIICAGKSLRIDL